MQRDEEFAEYARARQRMYGQAFLLCGDRHKAQEP